MKKMNKKANIVIETDAERLSRIKETGVFSSTEDIMAQIRAGDRHLTDGEVNALLESAKF